MAKDIICVATAALILIPVGIVSVKVNKRIPRSFMLNIFLYTFGIWLRVVTVFDKFETNL
jgi:hypothetical protein